MGIGKIKLARFSLCSLLLAVCLAGAGFGLWRRWESWFIFSASDNRNRATLELSFRSPNGLRMIGVSEGMICISNATTEEPLFSLHPVPPWPTEGIVMGFTLDNDNIVLMETEKAFFEWHRRRPEYWWGIAWLWEFWASALLSTALAWSLWRDWRRLRSASAACN